jgi:hypothetical protein
MLEVDLELVTLLRDDLAVARCAAAEFTPARGFVTVPQSTPEALAR